MEREYIIVELVARVEGDEVVLLDSSGKKVARMPASTASAASVDTLNKVELRMKWRGAFGGMINGLRGKVDRLQQTAWQRKFAVWQTSVRMRRNRQRHNAAKANPKTAARRFTHDSRPDWKAAIKCMVAQYHNIIRENVRRKKNPWRLWAQTVSGNLRKKAIRNEREIVCDGEATGKQTAQPAVHVQFDAC